MKSKREKGKTFPKEKASLTSCLSAWLGLVSLPRGRQVSPPLALARKLFSRRWGWGTVYQALRVLSRMMVMVVTMVKMMEIGWFVCSVIETVDPAVGHQALKPKSKPISQRMMTILPFFQMVKENNFHQRKWCFSHRWQLYVRRRSIPGLLWIPGSLYVRVCMAICVSAIRPNKHPQTVGNLWPPILEEENSFKSLISTQPRFKIFFGDTKIFVASWNIWRR